MGLDMVTYFVVAAARIQPWLLRTPDLRGMRGASLLLTSATYPEKIAGLGIIGAQPARDAGRISGVVALEFATPEAALAAQPTLLRYLTDELPGVEWEGWWCEAASYAAAESARRAGAGGGNQGSVRLLPAPRDFTPARACSCQREPARPYAAPPNVPEDVIARRRLGPDCHARDKAQRLEREVLKKKQGICARIPGKLPEDFDELARKGGLGPAGGPVALGRKDSRNHLATIVADGNAIGGLFQLMFEAGLFVDVTALRADLVTTLNEAVENAITTAASEVAGKECEVMPVIPHYGAGDDIFVSVPAVLAWKFCALLADAFAAAFAGARDSAAGLAPASCDSGEMVARQHIAAIRRALANVSLGIGMCFAHASHPIGETHHHAERAMDVAKKRGGGKASWIGWVDLTAAATGAHEQWCHGIPVETVLKELRSREVPDVFTLGPAGRSRLTTILRDQPSESAVENWAKRVRWQRDPRSATPFGDLAATLSRARWSSLAEDNKDARGGATS